MSINLSKGQKIDLTKSNPSVKKYRVALGWMENANVGEEFDVDVSLFVLGDNGKRLSDQHFVFYNNLQTPNGSIVHNGDAMSGGKVKGADIETIDIDFTKIEAEASEIVAVVTIHEADTKKQNFGMISDAFIRIVDADTNTEIMKFELDEDFSIETACEFGRLYKKDNEWRFNPTGVGRRGGLQEYINQF